MVIASRLQLRHEHNPEKVASSILALVIVFCVFEPCDPKPPHALSFCWMTSVMQVNSLHYCEIAWFEVMRSTQRAVGKIDSVLWGGQNWPDCRVCKLRKQADQQ